MARVGRRGNRPILKGGNRRKIIEQLIDERYPVYAEADIVVDSAREPPDVTVDRVLEALYGHLSTGETAKAAP
jgi:shikimate kinase